MNFKKIIIETPFYLPLLKIRKFIEYKKICALNEEKISEHAFCISPFKTGTTYLSGLFSTNNKVEHEPFQYTTIKNIDDRSFLIKRNQYLNLDLECSGFFSKYILELRDIFPNAPFLFLIRHPQDWILSVINYFKDLDEIVSYNYILRDLFDTITVYPIEKFFELDINKQTIIITSLLDYWIEVYSKAEDDEYSMIVKLDEVDQKINTIAEFLNLECSPNFNAWKRENKKKNTFELKDFINTENYKERVRKFGFDL